MINQLLHHGRAWWAAADWKKRAILIGAATLLLAIAVAGIIGGGPWA